MGSSVEQIDRVYGHLLHSEQYLRGLLDSYDSNAALAAEGRFTMRRSLPRTPKKEYPNGVRLVHNFYPGPHDDPGADRLVGLDGFRIWITDEPGNDSRCYCGWLDGREHYGTAGRIDAVGDAWWRGKRLGH